MKVEYVRSVTKSPYGNKRWFQSNCVKLTVDVSDKKYNYYLKFRKRFFIGDKYVDVVYVKDFSKFNSGLYDYIDLVSIDHQNLSQEDYEYISEYKSIKNIYFNLYDEKKNEYYVHVGKNYYIGFDGNEFFKTYSVDVSSMEKNYTYNNLDFIDGL